jgi:hypothetical protein
MRRLVVPRQAAQDGKVLAGVPRPAALPAGRCSLAQALMAALSHAGHPVSYDAVLGLPGVAVLPPPEMPPLSGDPLWEAYAAPGAGAACQPARSTGLWVARVVEAVGGVTAELRAPLGSADEALAAVREGVEGGLAVLLRGWPEGGEAWAVATGHDPARGVICGWPPDRDGDTYLGAAPGGSAAVILRPAPCQSPPRVQAALRALRHWSESWALHWERWGAWARWLEQVEGEEQRAQAAAAHQAAAEALADARTAGASFAGTCALLLGGILPVPELARAADSLARVAEALDEGPATEASAETWQGWQEAARETLKVAQRHDDAAHDELRAALGLML